MLTLLLYYQSFMRDRRAVTALEYGLIAAVVGAVMVVGARSLGTALSAEFTRVAGSV